MGVTSTQGFLFKLVANNVDLDLFADEEIKVSDNVTGLFDLGVLPAEFTRQITLPGTKKNNAFFEHFYDISVYNPILFATNAKIPCFLDFGGIYLAQGYLQLNQVNVLANKFIDSYEVSVFGSLSSFAREINRSFLTDMTSSLAKYNHTASLTNITASWNGDLFNGDIVYPMAEYGQKIIYSPAEVLTGIDSPSGSLFVQDYKPAIRIKKVWDAIFEEYGFTYSSSFFEQPFLNQVYMVCNNQLRYPIFDEVNLETYGQIRIGPVSGSTNNVLSANVTFPLPYFTILQNPDNNISQDLIYGIEYPSKLRGILNLNLSVSKSAAGNGVPQFDLLILDPANSVVETIELTSYNTFFNEVREGYISQNLDTQTSKYTLETEFNTPYLPSGSYKFGVKYTTLGGTNFAVILDPNNELKSTLSVTKVGNVGEGFVMNIGKNMPFGTNGIRKVDFITSIQKKFNLVIYPSKTQRSQFIVETFNEWYKRGELKDFNKYINLNEKIEVIPANNLAVSELNFGDTLDRDYISQQFNNLANREYGKTYYVDTENFFSQGTYEVKTGLASSPIIYLQGTGVSGSQDLDLNYNVLITDEFVRNETTFCPYGGSYPDTEIRRVVVQLRNSSNVNVVNNGGDVITTIEFTEVGCSSTFNFNQPITIPFGAASARYEYRRTAYVDCGSGPNCIEETIIPNCVVSITNAILGTGSTIVAC
jgi:hypothetical protein